CAPDSSGLFAYW
nr:immunoglobulin heavy chain junction region [Mus musculus]MBK4197180.1 immunoglobulin heavy chain junction region [Mus musculus]MBK4197181.1 immunoglobulin heavy chain junction region [Mus musculus]MBK4197182.1 immunoglobulin heavy chain junction region [Mus musculus]MBK4197183.1 immunoglobulin heavy chain junction region [Mus musculus]